MIKKLLKIYFSFMLKIIYEIIMNNYLDVFLIDF